MYVSSVRVLLGGKSFELEAKDGEMLLSALRRGGFSLPAACGGDAISRIRHTMDVPDGLGELSRIIRSQVEDMISSALAHCGTAFWSETPSCSTYSRIFRAEHSRRPV